MRDAIDHPVLRDVIVSAEPFRLGGRATPEPQAEPEHIRQPEATIDLDALIEQVRSQAFADGHRAAREALLTRQGERLAELEDEARATGHAQGLSSGRAEGQAALDAALAAARGALQAQWQHKLALLDNLLVQGAQQLSSYLVAAEDEIVALAFEAVAAVLGEVLTSSAGLRGTVANLIARQTHAARLKVHVHPHDWEEVLDDPDADIVSATEIEWIADADVALGGLVIHHAHGSLNASLGTVLQNLQSTLLQVRARRRSAALVASDRAAVSEGVAS